MKLNETLYVCARKHIEALAEGLPTVAAQFRGAAVRAILFHMAVHDLAVAEHRFDQLIELLTVEDLA